jgi:hypothetical protein|tara:strand:- start:205 stop:426 length:222 start_codon:yes stop_codon:yes gene_type:complete
MLIKNIVNDLATSVADLVSVPDQSLAWILRKRGWIVFQLDKEYRKCNTDSCLMRSYTDECEKLEATPIKEIKL